VSDAGPDRALQVLLNESRAEVHVRLDERGVADAPETVNLPRFDDENVPGAGFELLAVDSPHPSAFPDELDFIVWMTMWSGTFTREGVVQEHGDIDLAVVGSDEVVRAFQKRQVLLANP
jgi:hypothetical protein